MASQHANGSGSIRDYDGIARKQRVGSCLPTPQWQKKHISLSDGCFTWSAKAISSVGELKSQKGRSKAHSTIDFSLTPCAALAAEGHPDRIVLRPLDGCVWSPEDLHRGAGTGRDFLFDVGCSGIGRDIWLARFAEHIAYACGDEDEAETGSPRNQGSGACCSSLGPFGDYLARAFAGTGSSPETPERGSGGREAGSSLDPHPPSKEATDMQMAGNWQAAAAARGPGAIGGA